MTVLTFSIHFLLVLWTLRPAVGFVHSPRQTRRWAPPDADVLRRQTLPPSPTVLALAATDVDGSNNPLDELSEERKANLFQFLLRDLQVAGVPLLAVDAANVDTLQAALWTTLAELCNEPTENQACLVLEDLDVSVLQTFVDHFGQMQDRLGAALPELQRVNVSLVGKGVGPAILLAVGNTTTHDNEESSTTESTISEAQASAAFKAFWGRLGEKTDPLPYASPSPTSYKLCTYRDAPHVLSSFWNCVCELRATSEQDLGTSVLMLLGADDSHERFAALSDLLSTSLQLFQKGDDDAFRLAYYSPEYDRSKVFPADHPVDGHLPPTEWLRPMLRWTGHIDEASRLSDDELLLRNYQRRAPVTAVVVKRASLLAGSENSPQTSALDNGKTLSTQVVRLGVEGTKFLAAEGKQTLDDALAKERSILLE